MEIEGQPPAVKESDKTALPLRAITEDYFKLMGLPLLGGREFRSSDEYKAPKVAIVNQAFADRYFPQDNAIGRKIWMNGRDKPAMEIVGVVSNGRTDDLTQAASPEIYLSLWQATAFSKHLVIRTQADPRTVIVAVERELRAVDLPPLSKTRERWHRFATSLLPRAPSRCSSWSGLRWWGVC